MFAVLSGAPTGDAKLKVSVSQPPATVVIASVSQLIAPLDASSTFNLIVLPAAADQTLTVINVSLAVKGIAVAKPVAVLIVVPAQVCAPAVLITLITLLVALVGSTTRLEALPPKSVIV